MDIRHPAKPLSAEQLAMLAEAGLAMHHPVVMRAYSTRRLFILDCNNFPGHFWPPSTRIGQLYIQRPAFRRLELLFPQLVTQARACLRANEHGHYHVTRDSWAFLWKLYQLMSRLVDRTDYQYLGIQGEPDQWYLTR